MSRLSAVALALALAFLPICGRAVDAAALKARCAARIEQMATTMLPQEKLNRAMGFFGPVTKKYLPVFNRFNAEYLASPNKVATVKKYLPQADAALAEAKAMKIPAKYEAEKAEYVKMAEGFLMMTKLTVRFAE